MEASGTTRSKAEAELLLRLQTRSRPTGDSVTGATRLNAVADMWLREVNDSDKAVGTKERYREVVERHVRPALGSLRVHELSVGLIDSHLTAVRDRSGPSAAKAVRTALTGILGVAVRHDALQVNLAGQTRPVAVGSKVVVALAAEEVVALRQAVRLDPSAVAADFPDLIDLLLATGVRINEALALRWSHVDLGAETPTVSIAATLVREAGGGIKIQESPKSAAGRRVLQLPPFAVEMLLRRRVEQHANEFDVVFPSATGTLRDSRNVSKQWRAFGRRNPAWAAVTSHTFRKTVATVLTRQFDALTASAQLGHSSSAVTEKHYIQRTHRGPDVRALLSDLVAPAAESDE
ncbi:site-specific integrase [Nocardioides ganghwensis]|uniref:site-specific integrase n=1 Tax=Nocardioides ganghwensis TaxID=252230 RepID=UPI0013E9E64F|nr:site-specific integrase [Nocardioides ganghwensis]MBD3946346.1 site-specific integrase [Nocardioides ganghwensis]